MSRTLSACCRIRSAAVIAALLVWLVATASAQEPAAVVARVDGQPIYAHEVDRELTRALQGRKVDPAARTALRKAALDQLIDRQLILAYLRSKNAGPTEADVDQAVMRVEKQLKLQDTTLADYLRRAELTELEFRRALAWQQGWQRYLQRYLTDENLSRYFAQHRREFDGTTMRVAHILFPLDASANDSAAELEKALAKAAEVREQIVAGRMSFADAARAHSAAPTAQDGGDIGFIGRREPMPESFARAAFALDLDAISQPVVSPFGVHLIRCLEIRPGEKSWQAVRDQLEPAMIQYLFHWTADQQRPLAKIEILAENPR